MYHDALLDGHLRAAWGVRLEMILKSKFVLVDENGNENPDATKLLNKSWFLDFITYVMESKLWGHSLIQFTEMVNGEFSAIDIVPREHVKPELKLVVKEPNDEKGWSYLEPPFSQYCLSVGKSKDLGILLQCAPNAISKKYMGQFWDEFAEIFSVPIRIGKTNTQNVAAVTKLSQTLADMGRSAYGVLDNDSSIEIKETSKTDAYMVYDKRIERCDNENSKLIFGQTMLMDNGSSRSQAEVHKELAEMISDSDRRFVMFYMNEVALAFFAMHGYPVAGLSFKWDDENELDFEQQLKVDQWLINHFEVDLEYYKGKYNGQITGYKKTAAPIGGGDPSGK